MLIDTIKNNVSFILEEFLFIESEPFVTKGKETFVINL